MRCKQLSRPASTRGAGVEEVLSFEDATQWETWLASHYKQLSGAWVKVGKKASTKKSITAPEAGDLALCYGWIDSVRRSFDDDYFLQRYSRRRPKASWSKVNVDRVETLIAAGRMRAPGLVEVNAAKADGRWEAAYESQRNATIPPDLKAALNANRPAKDAFGRLGKTEQYLMILTLLKAQTLTARAARLQTMIARLCGGSATTS